jgi:flagellar hook-length control protein FliK
LPDAVKAEIPGLGTLLDSPGPAGLDGPALRAAVEGSGVLLETKLAAAPGGNGVEGAAAGGAGSAQMSAPEGDRKAALLRLGESLREHVPAAAVKAAGGSPAEAAVKADALVSTIEAYQLCSAAHGVLYAPMGLDWEELEDGELLFRKRQRGGGESYTCELNLDLRPLGRMGVSVTMYDGAFFVSFSPEEEQARFLMSSSSDEVAGRFRGAGLTLKAVAVQKRKCPEFGVPPSDGVDVRV